jgi:hypothetical protein
MGNKSCPIAAIEAAFGRDFWLRSQGFPVFGWQLFRKIENALKN